MKPHSGITLTETLVIVCLAMLLALMTMRCLIVSRELGGKGRQRAQVAILAQRELDAVLAAPSLASLPAEWLVDCPGPATSATLTLSPRSHGITEVAVAVRRVNLEGEVEVSLATLVEVAP